jgi:hypothetical protein
VIKNKAGQVAGAQINSASTGAPFVGAVTVTIVGDGVNQGVGSVGGGVATPIENGYYVYFPSQAETNFDAVAFTFVGSGAITATTTYPTILESQQVALQSSTVANAVPVLTLLTDAAIELGLIDAVGVLEAADQQFMLRKLNRIFDNWNADPDAANVEIYSQFTVTPSLNPQTIGPTSATWTVTARPDDVIAATLFLSGTSPVIRFPLVKRDQPWWTRNTIQAQPSSLPTSFYYQPTWPNGNFFFWPLCTAGLTVELLTRQLFDTQALAATIGLPFGYQDALILTLAEECAGPFTKPLSPKLELSARQARARIFGKHQAAPTLRTADDGMPGSGSRSASGTYLDGWQGGR